MDEPFASLDAIVRARIIQDVVALVERERHQRAARHPRSRRGDQPLRRRLSALAGTARAHHAALSRCRSRGRAIRCTRACIRPSRRSTNSCGADLSREVDHRGGGGVMMLDPRYAWMRQLVALRGPARARGRRPAAPACSIRCSRRARAGSARRSSNCSPTAASGRISRRPSPPRSAAWRSASSVGILLGVVAALVPAQSPSCSSR